MAVLDGKDRHARRVHEKNLALGPDRGAELDRALNDSRRAAGEPGLGVPRSVIFSGKRLLGVQHAEQVVQCPGAEAFAQPRLGDLIDVVVLPDLATCPVDGRLIEPCLHLLLGATERRAVAVAVQKPLEPTQEIRRRDLDEGAARGLVHGPAHPVPDKLCEALEQLFLVVGDSAQFIPERLIALARRGPLAANFGEALVE